MLVYKIFINFNTNFMNFQRIFIKIEVFNIIKYLKYKVLRVHSQSLNMNTRTQNILRIRTQKSEYFF